MANLLIAFGSQLCGKYLSLFWQKSRVFLLRAIIISFSCEKYLTCAWTIITSLELWEVFLLRAIIISLSCGNDFSCRQYLFLWVVRSISSVDNYDLFQLWEVFLLWPIITFLGLWEVFLLRVIIISLIIWEVFILSTIIISLSCEKYVSCGQWVFLVLWEVFLFSAILPLSVVRSISPAEIMISLSCEKYLCAAGILLTAGLPQPCRPAVWKASPRQLHSGTAPLLLNSPHSDQGFLQIGKSIFLFGRSISLELTKVSVICEKYFSFL